MSKPEEKYPDWFLWLWEKGVVVGLLMGLGFITGGYCPGTSLVAVGIGKIDAIVFTLGMMVGIFIFSEAFSSFESLYTGAYMGNIKITEVLNMSAELFVFLFFGLAAVCGSYYLQTLHWSWTALMAGAAVGLPAAAVLMINNYRDLETDRDAGKHTLAVTLGRPAIRYLYALSLTLPVLVTFPLNKQGIPALTLSLPWLSLVPAWFLIRKLWHSPIDKRLNRLLAQTAQWQLLFGVLLSMALTL